MVISTNLGYLGYYNQQVLILWRKKYKVIIFFWLRVFSGIQLIPKTYVCNIYMYISKEDST